MRGRQWGDFMTKRARLPCLQGLSCELLGWTNHLQPGRAPVARAGRGHPARLAGCRRVRVGPRRGRRGLPDGTQRRVRPRLGRLTSRLSGATRLSKQAQNELDWVVTRTLMRALDARDALRLLKRGFLCLSLPYTQAGLKESLSYAPAPTRLWAAPRGVSGVLEFARQVDCDVPGAPSVSACVGEPFDRADEGLGRDRHGDEVDPISG